jgi:hypothetical protein
MIDILEQKICITFLAYLILICASPSLSPSDKIQNLLLHPAVSELAVPQNSTFRNWNT